jgi:acyl carrier protein
MTTVTTLTYDQVMEKLPAIVADCLGVDLEDVVPEAGFFTTLGGDSIDLLDLNFRCEKGFTIKSPFRLWLGSRDQFTVDGEGCLTDDALQLIRTTYPFFWKAIEGGGKLKPDDLLSYFTVDMIAKFVVHAAETQAAGSQSA